MCRIILAFQITNKHIANFRETIPLTRQAEAAFLVFLRYDAGTILETMPKLGYDHRTAFSEKQQGR
jgi:hypothetical protein